jgi:hypothetical protein
MIADNAPFTVGAIMTAYSALMRFATCTVRRTTFLRAVILLVISSILFVGSWVGSLAQSADPALTNLNNCLSAAKATSETDFMKGLNPALNDPDRVAWCLFLYVNSNASTTGNNNALFETWASDNDTFQTNPVWPGPGAAEMALRRPVLPHLGLQQAQQQSQPPGLFRPFVLPFSSSQCTPGQLCVGEEVRRNKATFDYINDNKLYTEDGLRSSTITISFPADSIEIKANWVPVSQLAMFLQGSGSPNDPSLYHVNSTTENGQQVQYALVSFHIISKMVPNWTWATFEHMNNPGRCDELGCYDTFGANPAATLPNPPNMNPGLQYPNCVKTPALTALFATGKIDPAFMNYCLKATQTDFTDAQGVVTRDGNSVTEQGFLDTASCMSCHARAAYSFVTGAYASNHVFLYSNPNTPIAPLGIPDPGQFWLHPEKDPMSSKDMAIPIFKSSDFVWSIPFCAVANGKSRCAVK